MPPKQKALDKQAQNEALKQQKAVEDAERAESAAWSVGAKDSAKQKQREDEEILKRQKVAEKAALEAAEEAELSGIQRKGKPTKKKGKDDFDFLKAALAQQPKTKAQKDAEERQKQAEERKLREAQIKEEKERQRQVLNSRVVNLVRVTSFIG